MDIFFVNFFYKLDTECTSFGSAFIVVFRVVVAVVRLSELLAGWQAVCLLAAFAWVDSFIIFSLNSFHCYDFFLARCLAGWLTDCQNGCCPAFCC